MCVKKLVLERCSTLYREQLRKELIIMVTDHREIAFEQAIEADLLATGEYTKGDPAGFDRQLALHPDILFTFIKESQPKAWERLETVHGSQVEQKVLHRLNQVLDQRGMLHVLRKGIEDYGVH